MVDCGCVGYFKLSVNTGKGLLGHLDFYTDCLFPFLALGCSTADGIHDFADLSYHVEDIVDYNGPFDMDRRLLSHLFATVSIIVLLIGTFCGQGCVVLEVLCAETSNTSAVFKVAGFETLHALNANARAKKIAMLLDIIRCTCEDVLQCIIQLSFLFLTGMNYQILASVIIGLLVSMGGCLASCKKAFCQARGRAASRKSEGPVFPPIEVKPCALGKRDTE